MLLFLTAKQVVWGILMLGQFTKLIEQGNSKAAFITLFSAKEHEVIECLHSVGVTSFSGSKEQIIDRNKQAVLDACCKR